MSTLMYAAMTGKREQAEPGTSTTTKAPGLKVYVDALAALVPAEVLGVHAAILTFTTKTGSNRSVEITDLDTLHWVFYALVGLSALVYVAGRGKTSWGRWDWVRVLIPPLAFTGWTMLQRGTAFDAVAPAEWAQGGARSAIAIIGAVVLGLLASALAYKADLKQPPG